MDVILLERVAKLGQMGDVVSVKEGYARNFLLPQKKALRASEENKAYFEEQRAQLEARNLETRKEAEALAEQLEGRQFVVIRSASDSGSLYGSVTPRDAAETASAEGLSISHKQIALKAPIKELGLHDLEVRLHPEVEVTIQVNVARSAEEAELQAAGLSVDQAEDGEEAASELEIAEIFDDASAAVAEDSELIQTGETDGDGEEQPEIGAQAPDARDAAGQDEAADGADAAEGDSAAAHAEAGDPAAAGDAPGEAADAAPDGEAGTADSETPDGDAEDGAGEEPREGA